MANFTSGISRRALLRSVGISVVSKLSVDLGNAQSRTRGRLILLHDLPDAQLLAISSNGERIATYTARKAGVLGEDKWSAETAFQERTQDVLRLIDVKSGQRTCSVYLRSNVAEASFWSADLIFVETGVFHSRGDSITQTVVIDAATRSLTEQLRVAVLRDSVVKYQAIATGELLEVDAQLRTAPYNAFSRVTFPELKVIERVGLVQEASSANQRSVLFFSSDRRKFVYCLDQSVFCRRVEDLKLVWTKAFDRRAFGAPYNLSVSATGAYIAVAMGTRATGHFTFILDGESGMPIGRVEVSGEEGVAISPDGSQLAVGKKILDRETSTTSLMAEVYNIHTGNLVASGLHVAVPSGRMQSLYAAIIPGGLQFTSNGQQLITSSPDHVKIWSL